MKNKAPLASSCHVAFSPFFESYSLHSFGKISRAEQVKLNGMEKSTIDLGLGLEGFEGAVWEFLGKSSQKSILK